MSHEQGVSTGSLLGAFFAVVVLCAVIFSLGFFLGYRQGHPTSALQTEQVPPATESPSNANPPASAPASFSSQPAAPADLKPSGAAEAQRDGSETSQSPSTAPAEPADENENPSEGLDSREPADSATPSRVPAGLLVQVAAVTNQQDATNVVSVLRSKSYPALILTPAQAKSKDGFYRVVAGPYRTRTDAEKARKQLTAEGFKPFIR